MGEGGKESLSASGHKEGKRAAARGWREIRMQRHRKGGRNHSKEGL